MPRLKLEFYINPIQGGFAHQFLFGEGTEYWGATKGPIQLNGEAYRDLHGARVIKGWLVTNAGDLLVKKAGTECFVDYVEFGADSGDLTIAETEGKVTSISCSGSETAGLFTHCGGTQTAVFRAANGQESRCPGTFYFALGNFFGAAEHRSGGVDWAFVVSRGTDVPEWVESFGKRGRLEDPNNTFLTPGKAFTGSQMRKMDEAGRWVDVQPKLGEEFGPDKKLLMVGKMEKSGEGWRIRIRDRVNVSRLSK